MSLQAAKLNALHRHPLTFKGVINVSVRKCGDMGSKENFIAKKVRVYHALE